MVEPWVKTWAKVSAGYSRLRCSTAIARCAGAGWLSLLEKPSHGCFDVFPQFRLSPALRIHETDDWAREENHKNKFATKEKRKETEKVKEYFFKKTVMEVCCNSRYIETRDKRVSPARLPL